MSHVTHINESGRRRERAKTHFLPVSTSSQTRGTKCLMSSLFWVIVLSLPASILQHDSVHSCPVSATPWRCSTMQHSCNTAATQLQHTSTLYNSLPIYHRSLCTLIRVPVQKVFCKKALYFHSRPPGPSIFLVLQLTRDTGWRRPIGCLKSQAIFRKRATDYRALLRKMTHQHKAS